MEGQQDTSRVVPQTVSQSRVGVERWVPQVTSIDRRLSTVSRGLSMRWELEMVIRTGRQGEIWRQGAA